MFSDGEANICFRANFAIIGRPEGTEFDRAVIARLVEHATDLALDKLVLDVRNAYGGSGWEAVACLTESGLMTEDDIAEAFREIGYDGKPAGYDLPTNGHSG